MTKVEELAADYWIENTARIYAENLHVSTPVMEAYEAGFECALENGVQAIMDLYFGLRECGSEPTRRDLVKLAKRIRKAIRVNNEDKT